MTRHLNAAAVLSETTIMGSPRTVGSALVHVLGALVVAAAAVLAARWPVWAEVQAMVSVPDGVPNGPWLGGLVVLALAGLSFGLVRRAAVDMGRQGRVVVMRDRVVLMNHQTGKVDRSIPLLTIAGMRQSRWAVTLDLTTGAKVTLLKPLSSARTVARVFDEVADQVRDARQGAPVLG